MNTEKHNRRRNIKPARTLNLQAVFAPGGEAAGDTVAFLDFWIAANERTTALKQKDLRKRKARLARCWRG